MKKYPERKLKLLFAGVGHEDWFEEQVMQYAREHGVNCEYLGFQPPREVFGISDLSVLSSVSEGFALVCTESLAMECPVVRSDSPGHSDMSDVVLVHKQENLEDLTEKIEYAMTHVEEMQAMAQKGRIKCETVFSLEEMCRKTMETYQDVIKRTF